MANSGKGKAPRGKRRKRRRGRRYTGPNPVQFIEGIARMKLPSGDIVLLDRADYPLVAMFRWNVWHNGETHHLYAKSARQPGCKPQYMHRVITSPRRGLVVDHINGNGLDNRRSNLKVVTPAINARNRKRRPVSGFYGVVQTAPHNYLAQTVVCGVRYWLYHHDLITTAYISDELRRALVAECPDHILNFPGVRNSIAQALVAEYVEEALS